MTTKCYKCRIDTSRGEWFSGVYVCVSCFYKILQDNRHRIEENKK